MYQKEGGRDYPNVYKVETLKYTGERERDRDNPMRQNTHTHIPTRTQPGAHTE